MSQSVSHTRIIRAKTQKSTLGQHQPDKQAVQITGLKAQGHPHWGYYGFTLSLDINSLTHFQLPDSCLAPLLGLVAPFPFLTITTVTLGLSINFTVRPIHWLLIAFVRGQLGVEYKMNSEKEFFLIQP